MTTKQKPVHIVRLGRVKAAIWANPSDKLGTRHTVTVCRIYKVGDEWRESSSFSRDELPLVGKVISQAHTWIFEHGKDTPE